MRRRGFDLRCEGVEETPLNNACVKGVVWSGHPVAPHWLRVGRRGGGEVGVLVIRLPPGSEGHSPWRVQGKVLLWWSLCVGAMPPGGGLVQHNMPPHTWGGFVYIISRHTMAIHSHPINPIHRIE